MWRRSIGPVQNAVALRRAESVQRPIQWRLEQGVIKFWAEKSDKSA
jgi:hypothetical protein